MDVSKAGQALSQVTVQGAQARLAGLTQGMIYRVEITDLLPGKVEFLLGNQYLLATTSLRFTAGDVVNLRLVQRSPELLVFQLALPSSASLAQYSADAATLLRAAGLPATAVNQQALAMLVRSGTPVSGGNIDALAQLLNTYPPEALAGFLPLYKELIQRGLKLNTAILNQLAQLPLAAPELAGLLAESLAQLRSNRAKGRGSSRKLEDAVEAALARYSDDDDLPTAQALKEQLRLLYGSPECTLRDAIVALHREARERDSEAEDTLLPSEAAELTVDLHDLHNLAAGDGEELPPELAQAFVLMDAQRVKDAIANDTQAVLPLLFDGEPVTVQMSVSVLAEQYYQKDYTVRLRITGASQGDVEIQLRTRGPGLYVDVSAEKPATVEAYRARLDEFAKELPETGFIPRRLDARVGQV